MNGPTPAELQVLIAGLSGVGNDRQVDIWNMLSQVASGQIDIKVVMFGIQHSQRSRFAHRFSQIAGPRLLQRLGQTLQVITALDQIIVGAGFEGDNCQFLMTRTGQNHHCGG